MASVWNTWIEGMLRSFWGRLYLWAHGYRYRYYGTFSFTAAAAQANTQIDIGIVRANGSYGTVGVDVVAVDGTAVRGVDYFVNATTTLSWVNGDVTFRYIHVILVNPTTSSKSFTLRLQNATGDADIDPAYDEITVTIPQVIGPQGLLKFMDASQGGTGIDVLYVPESSAGVYSAKVGRFVGATGAVGCSWHTADGTATAGVDYTADSGVLAWADGNTDKKPIAVTTLAVGSDSLYFWLVIDTPTGGVQIPAAPKEGYRCKVYIRDIPAANGLLQFTVAQVQVPEGAAYTFTVQRIYGKTGAVNCTYTCANGTAVSGTDYTAASAVLNWLDGDGADKTFNITMLAVSETNKYFTITLSAFGGGSAAGPNVTITVFIQDTGVIPPDLTSDTIENPVIQIISEEALDTPGVLVSPREIHVVVADGISGTVIGFSGATGSFGGGSDLASEDDTFYASPPARFSVRENT